MKPTVAHLLRSYLPLTETFIHRSLMHLHRYHPVVLARRTENLASFPFEPVHAVSRQSSTAQAWNYLSLKAWGRQPFALRTLRHLRPDLLHAHFGPEGVSALPLRRALGVPLITSFYGRDMSRLPRSPAWRRRYRRLFRDGDGFLVEGGTMRRELIALGCPEERTHLLHIGVDLEAFPFRARTLSAEEPVHLLVCARLVEKKGVAYAIDALARVAGAFPRVQLRVVGDGPLRSEIEERIGTRALGDRVHMLGALPHDAYVRELEGAHILLTPSVRADDGDSEGGAPTVLLEAQAAGLPVLATRHADIPEVVGMKEPGLLVPERDADALAAGLRMMLENPQRWPEWGAAGRRHVEEDYDVRRTARALEAIYDRVRGPGDAPAGFRAT